MRLSRKILLCLLLVLILPARADETATLDTPREIADTLCDMLVYEQGFTSLRERMFVSPAALTKVFAPRSRWGNERMEAYAQPWREAFATLIAGMRRRDELATALSPGGLKMPFDKAFFNDAPEYMALDKLLRMNSAPGCNFEPDGPSCAIIVNLKVIKGGNYELIRLRVVDPDGNLVPIPGKVQ